VVQIQETVREWTLCGSRRTHIDRGSALATEDPRAVTCRFCRQLAGVQPKASKAHAA
jgi:hypothetical protein